METSKFVKFNLSDKDTQLGQQLTTLNLQVIHNLRTDLAEEKLALKFDPNNVLVYAQQEAELQGKILVLSYILDCAEVAKEQPDIVA